MEKLGFRSNGMTPCRRSLIFRYNCEKNSRESMKLPKGFGRNYFSLNAITATVNQVTINAVKSRALSYHVLAFDGENQDSEMEEEELATLCPLQLSQKTCHCNRYFFKRASKTLKLHFNQKRFFHYFKTLNNSISPPLFFL